MATAECLERRGVEKKKIGIILAFVVGNFNLAEALLCQKSKRARNVHIGSETHPVREQAHNPNALQEAFSEKFLRYLYTSVHKPRWTKHPKMKFISLDSPHSVATECSSSRKFHVRSL